MGLVRFLGIVCLLYGVAPIQRVAHAFETDQFNLPPAPLADIGPEMTTWVVDHLSTSVERTNERIEFLEACLKARRHDPDFDRCSNFHDTRYELAYLRSGVGLSGQFYDRVAAGLPTSRIEQWIEDHVFAVQPDRFKASRKDSIFLGKWVLYNTIGVTVNTFGHEIGTDKIGHFFQQGYGYFKAYAKNLRKHLHHEATRRAIEGGISTENGLYGMFLSGVYSNADLAANFAGLQFYRGLFEPTRLGGQERAPYFRLEGGYWKITGDVLAADFIRPYFSDHMSEAWVPSTYSRSITRRVEVVLRDRACASWKSRFPALTLQTFQDRATSLQLWDGQDYGFTRPEKGDFVSIASICF